MKKIIFFNILITLAWFPYSMQRWMHMPYDEGVWSLEIFVVFGSFLLGAGLSLSNIGLLISLWWTKAKVYCLKATMIFTALLFIFPIYAGIVVGSTGEWIWVDILALGIFYGMLYLSNKELHQLVS